MLDIIVKIYLIIKVGIDIILCYLHVNYILNHWEHLNKRDFYIYHDPQ